MKTKYIILLFILWAISCHRKIEGRNSVELYPSEVYINTCGEIFDHFSFKKSGSGYRYEVQSNTFLYLETQIAKNGCIEKMTYGLHPGGLENVIFRINMRYHMDLKDQPCNDITLFKENGKTVKVNVSESLFEVYMAD